MTIDKSTTDDSSSPKKVARVKRERTERGQQLVIINKVASWFFLFLLISYADIYYLDRDILENVIVQFFLEIALIPSIFLPLGSVVIFPYILYNLVYFIIKKDFKGFLVATIIAVEFSMIFVILIIYIFEIGVYVT